MGNYRIHHAQYILHVIQSTSQKPLFAPHLLNPTEESGDKKKCHFPSFLKPLVKLPLQKVSAALSYSVCFLYLFEK